MPGTIPAGQWAPSWGAWASPLCPPEAGGWGLIAPGSCAHAGGATKSCPSQNPLQGARQGHSPSGCMSHVSRVWGGLHPSGPHQQPRDRFPTLVPNTGRGGHSCGGVGEPHTLPCPRPPPCRRHPAHEPAALGSRPGSGAVTLATTSFIPRPRALSGPRVPPSSSILPPKSPRATGQANPPLPPPRPLRPDVAQMWQWARGGICSSCFGDEVGGGGGRGWGGGDWGIPPTYQGQPAPGGQECPCGHTPATCSCRGTAGTNGHPPSVSSGEGGPRCHPPQHGASSPPLSAPTGRSPTTTAKESPAGGTATVGHAGTPPGPQCLPV